MKLQRYGLWIPVLLLASSLWAQPPGVERDSQVVLLTFTQGTERFGLQVERPSESRLVAVEDVRLVEGDMVIDYRIFSSGVEASSFVVSLEVRAPGPDGAARPLPLTADVLQGSLGNIYIKEGETRQIVWQNVLESLVFLEEQLELALRVEFVPFVYEPRLGFKEDKPYLIGAIAGVVAAGAGVIILECSAKPAYEDYKARRGLRNSLQEAEPFYQDANSKRHRALGFLVAGGTLLLVDGALFLLKQIDKSRQIKEYRQENSVQFKSTWQSLGNNNYIGLSFNYTF